MFIAMREASFEQVVGLLFNLEVKPTEPEVSVGLVTEADGAPMDVLGRVSAVSGGADAEPAKPRASQAAAPLAKGLGGKEQDNLTYSAPDESGEARTTSKTEAKSGKRPGRNQPCFCGSGKKYKACHGSTVSA